MKKKEYRALISSDWNQCLAPCGPFDVIAFTYPELAAEIDAVFKKYTGNSITLGTAVKKMQSLLPEPISTQQMDTYLDEYFTTYSGVTNLISWCLDNGFLFMINTTGPMGYFQRAFAKNLLPRVPVLAANPLLHYPASKTDPCLYPLRETPEKAQYTADVLRKYNISPSKTIVIGDSGGDGPHFEWAKRNSIFKIACMTKHSLMAFCTEKKIEINLHFGPVYSRGEKRELSREMAVDFLQLGSVFEKICG